MSWFRLCSGQRGMLGTSIDFATKNSSEINGARDQQVLRMSERSFTISTVSKWQLLVEFNDRTSHARTCSVYKFF